jgi:hypothetical protein
MEIPPPPQPSSDDLKKLIEISFWASLRREEGRSNAFRLVYQPPPSHPNEPFIFENPIQFNVANCLKLAPALEGSYYSIGVWADESDGLAIWGHTVSVEPGILRLHASEPGTIKVSYDGIGAIVTERKAGFRLNNLSQYPPSLKMIFSDDELIRSFRSGGYSLILDAVRSHGKGGTIIVPFSDSWRESVCTPMAYGGKSPFTRAYDSQKPILDLYDHTKEKTDLDRLSEVVPNLKNLLGPYYVSLRNIGQLTAVDGAVIMMPDLRVHAYGARIKAQSGSSQVDCATLVEPIEGDTPRKVRITEIGGLRHQSAAQFAFDQKDSLAIVVSHDGPITLFAWDDRIQSLVAVRNADLLFA